MVFSSLEFLCVFLPVVLVLYSIVPGLWAKNALLIIASLAFYAYGEPVYVLLMLGSVLVNYILALIIGRKNSNAIAKKAVMVLDILANLGVLAVFKYADFFIGTINDICKTDIPLPQITLPIGISFFTFQALSYVIDVYRGDCEAQKDPFKLLLYISFFPQLIAGPIIKYHDVCKALSDRKQTFDDTALGIRRFIFGLGKKVLIANAAGKVADILFTSDMSDINVISAWIAAIAYMLQIYFDFSGYSDMAIGLGRMFGFHYAENFDHPYGSLSIKEFWRRWHISLSTWFKEYLYIPLGGNRKGKARTSINKIIVFFTTGLWHGANWTFVVWGLYHGFFLLLEDYVPKLKKLPKVLGHIYSVLVVCIGFVIFRADDMGQACTMIGRMFAGTNFSAQAVSIIWQVLTPYSIVMLILGILFAAPVPMLYEKLKASGKIEKSEKSRAVISAASYVVSIALLGWCMLRLSGNTYNPFIYFRF